MKGAPRTQSLSVNSPVNNYFAIGGSLVHDKIGPISESTIGFDVAYRIRVKRRQTISFGVKPTFTMFQANFRDVNLASDYYGETDLDFEGVSTNFVIPNIGFGMYYYTGKMYIGLSSPKMVTSKIAKPGSVEYFQIKGRIAPTYYFMMGRNFKINRDLKFQPNILTRITLNAPISFGFHANFIYLKEITVGTFYQHQESIGLLFQWKFDRKWKIGYSLGFSTNQFIQTNFGSHEIMLNYTLKHGRKRFVHPQYF